MDAIRILLEARIPETKDQPGMIPSAQSVIIVEYNAKIIDDIDKKIPI